MVGMIGVMQYVGAGHKWCGVVGMVWSDLEVQHKVKGVSSSVGWRR